MDIIRWVRNEWDRSLAVVLLILGLVSLLLGWQGVADGLVPTEQLPYLASGGLLGVFCLGVAATLWLSADLRDEWRKLNEILECMEEELGARSNGANRGARQSSGADGTGEHPPRRRLRADANA